MALVDLPRFKEYIGEQHSANDTTLQMMLDAAHEAVFQHLRRRVELVATPTPDPTPRVFVPADRWSVDTDDFIELDSVLDGTTEIASGYYQLEPLNGRSASGEARPYDTIRRTNAGEWVRVDRTTASVTVSAVWGWASVPEAIKLAILMVAKDMVSSKDVAFGVQAFTEQALVRIRENPTVQWMLRDYRKDGVLVA